MYSFHVLSTFFQLSYFFDFSQFLPRTHKFTIFFRLISNKKKLSRTIVLFCFLFHSSAYFHFHRIFLIDILLLVTRTRNYVVKRSSFIVCDPISHTKFIADATSNNIFFFIRRFRTQIFMRFVRLTKNMSFDVAAIHFMWKKKSSYGSYITNDERMSS